MHERTTSLGATLRRLLKFQLKLAADALRDLVMSPVSIGAVLLDLFQRNESGATHFERLMTLGHRSERRPLVYHVGFDANYTTLAFPLGEAQLSGREPLLAFRVDLLRLFTGGSSVDMVALPTVKFDQADAARLAGNYRTMISPL